MMQIWFISIIYLVYTGFLLMTQEYGIRIPILLNMREYLLSNKKIFIFIMFLGYVLTVFNCFFPNIPGPIILGDLFVTIALLMSSFWYNHILFTSNEKLIINQSNKKLYVKMAIFNFIVAFLHLIFPNWVFL